VLPHRLPGIWSPGLVRRIENSAQPPILARVQNQSRFVYPVYTRACGPPGCLARVFRVASAASDGSEVVVGKFEYFP
jgi:hypothetical protein